MKTSASRTLAFVNQSARSLLAGTVNCIPVQRIHELQFLVLENLQDVKN